MTTTTELTNTLRQCCGWAKYDLPPHEAPVEDFGVTKRNGKQESQRLCRNCRAAGYRLYNQESERKLANKLKAAEQTANSRAEGAEKKLGLKLGALGRITADDVRAVFERDDWTCQWSGVRPDDIGDLSLDHCVELRNSGLNHPDNLQTLLCEFNREKASGTILDSPPANGIGFDSLEEMENGPTPADLRLDPKNREPGK